MSPDIIASLAATWLIWGSTYLAIQWALAVAVASAQRCWVFL